MVLMKWEVGSWKLEVGSGKLEVGSWKLEVGSWKFKRYVTSSPPAADRLSQFYIGSIEKQETRRQRITAYSLKLKAYSLKPKAKYFIK
jgi:hypothetical protein